MWGLKRIRKVKYPKPSPLAKHIKDLGAEANLIAKLTEVKLFQAILTDFTEIKCSFGTIIYLILFSDMLSKRIIGWNVSFHKDTENALKGYFMAKRYLKRMKANLNSVIIHQDQDTVFTGYEYAGTLLNDGISLSFTEKGFKDNPFMESCIGHFKDEYKHLIQEAKNIDEAKDIIRKCIKDWNKERIHSALKGRSPDEFIHTFCKLKKG
jgi:transposase InsO family protein